MTETPDNLHYLETWKRKILYCYLRLVREIYHSRNLQYSSEMRRSTRKTQARCRFFKIIICINAFFTRAFAVDIHSNKSALCYTVLLNNKSNSQDTAENCKLVMNKTGLE